MFDHISIFVMLFITSALAVTGAWKGTSLNKIYDELGWETLTDRRWFRRLDQFYKIRNDLTPEYLRTPLPAIRTNSHRTRSEKAFREINCKQTSYINSIYPNSVKIWNEIGPEHRQVRSLNHKFLIQYAHQKRGCSIFMTQ